MDKKECLHCPKNPEAKLPYDSMKTIDLQVKTNLSNNELSCLACQVIAEKLQC